MLNKHIPHNYARSNVYKIINKELVGSYFTHDKIKICYFEITFQLIILQ